MRFSNKTALVTGAAVGIGRAVACKLASEGANLVALDINEEKLADLKSVIVGMGGKIETFTCNIADEDEVNAAFKKAREAFGKIHILINNAALWRDKSPFLETTTQMWQNYLNVNVMGVVYCTKAALPDMLESGFGRIVNVASVAGVYGNAQMAHYSATKGALIAMTQALAKEVADKGVTVNAVSPGTVSPSSVSDDGYVQECPMNYMGRTGSDKENADLICFLASDEASYISGQNIQIDGCRKKI